MGTCTWFHIFILHALSIATHAGVGRPCISWMGDAYWRNCIIHHESNISY